MLITLPSGEGLLELRLGGGERGGLRCRHILRVGEYSALIARELGMPEKFIENIRLHATLHDVGKVHIHTDILRKPARLDGPEMEEMKKLSEKGFLLLVPLFELFLMLVSPFLAVANMFNKPVKWR